VTTLFVGSPEADVRPVEVIDVNTSLHDALGLTPDQAVTSYKALNRLDYNRDRVRVEGGAMVVQCEVAGIGIDGIASRSIEIDDNHRSLPEAVITTLGAEAIREQWAWQCSRKDGGIIYRTVLEYKRPVWPYWANK